MISPNYSHVMFALYSQYRCTVIRVDNYLWRLPEDLPVSAPLGNDPHLLTSEHQKSTPRLCMEAEHVITCVSYSTGQFHCTIKRITSPPCGEIRAQWSVKLSAANSTDSLLQFSKFSFPKCTIQEY